MKYILLLSGLLIGCAQNTQISPEPIKKEKTTINQTQNELPKCLDESGNDLTCDYDNDCCPNFYCGIDIEKSRRQKYCLYTGK